MGRLTGVGAKWRGSMDEAGADDDEEQRKLLDTHVSLFFPRSVNDDRVIIAPVYNLTGD
jgi:hypothetical protein